MHDDLRTLQEQSIFTTGKIPTRSEVEIGTFPIRCEQMFNSLFWADNSLWTYPIRSEPIQIALVNLSTVRSGEPRLYIQFTRTVVSSTRGATVCPSLDANSVGKVYFDLQHHNDKTNTKSRQERTSTNTTTTHNRYGILALTFHTALNTLWERTVFHSLFNQNKTIAMPFSSRTPTLYGRRNSKNCSWERGREVQSVSFVLHCIALPCRLYLA